VNLVNHAGIKEDTLGERGLTGIDMRADTDIAKVVERSHGLIRLFQKGDQFSTGAATLQA
jgi:hypothetical protein